MALVPTLLALVVGLVLGLRWGGRLEHVLEWRPVQPLLLLTGLLLGVVADVGSPGGSFGVLVSLAALATLLAFAVLNVRVGGMVLVVAGLGLDLLVALLNWGTPVSGAALTSAGVVEEGALDTVRLSGGRELADGAVLGFLGDVIPLPWGQVVSIGDLLTLVGIALVTASVVRRYEVRGGRPVTYRGGGLGGPRDYRSALDALGRGPAPRRGPGLHPSRLDERRRGARSRQARAPRQGPEAARRRPGPPPR